MEALVPLLLFGAVAYVLLIRPQQRRLRAHQAVVASLQVGDEVITAGGIIGRIMAIEDDSVRLEVSPGTELRVLRGAIQQKIGPEAAIEPDEGDAA